ncbi:MAG: PAS domain S-box protein [Candidatus Omnitrophica bacterium]|nr:PAS domain S-box protein [Candidatus Omnitrophota bacterium]
MKGSFIDMNQACLDMFGYTKEEIKLHKIIDTISDGITVSDMQGQFMVFNEKMREISGYTIDEVNRQKDFDVLIHPQSKDHQEVLKRLNEIFSQGTTRETQTTIQAKDGSEKTLLVSTALFNYKNRDMFLSVWRDITERKRLENVLNDSEIRFRRLFETAQDGILIMEEDTGQITEVNPFLVDMLGYSREELLGKKLWEVGAFVDVDKSKTAFIHLQSKGYIRYENLPLQAKDGHLVSVEFISNSYRVGRKKVIQCNIRNITERRRLEIAREYLHNEIEKSNQKLEQLALKDSHTGLYNHRYLKEALEVNLARAQRQFAPVSVIMMDMDHFKSINDVYGHVFGDLILTQFAARLTKTVRPYDAVIRYGGEEFIVVSPDLDRAGALVLAQRILKTVSLFPFGDSTHSIKLTLSLAVVSYPEDVIDINTDLVDPVDRILNKAKEDGGNRVYSSLDTKNGSVTARETATIQLIKKKIEKLAVRANHSLIEEALAFARKIKLKDNYNGEQVERTAGWAVKISRALHFSKDKIELIRQAAMLHDLGKAGINEHILRKNSKLDTEEFEEIKKHPQIGVDIISPIHSLYPIKPFLLYHHERWDGKGYPKGLAGESIPLGARIIAIADVYQALVSNRPYRKAYSKENAVKIIRKAAGTQFDPDIVKACLMVLKNEL